MKAKQSKKAVPNLIEKKEHDYFKSIGRAIVATELRAEGTVRDALVKCFDYTPEQITDVENGVKTAYEKHLTDLMNDNFMLNTNLDGGFSGKKQAVYNRRSEKRAVLESFRLAASWTVKERAIFKDAVQGAHGYHALVALCRATVTAANEGEKPNSTTPQATGELKAGSMKAIERNIKRASIEQLLVLRESIAARIAMLKPKQHDIGTVASIRKARKAIGQKAKAAVKAVNRRAA